MEEKELFGEEVTNEQLMGETEETSEVALGETQPPVEAPEEPEEQEEQPKNYERNLKAALKEEREKRKAFEAKMHQMEGRFQMMMESLQKKEEPPVGDEEPEPNREEDPVGYLEWKVKNLEKQLATTSEKTDQTVEQQKQTAEFTRFQSSVASDEQAFSQENPDYGQAVQWLWDRRTAELKALGYNDQQMKVAIAQDALWLSNTAMQQQKRPSEFTYSYAKALGWKSSEQPAPNAGQIPNEGTQKRQAPKTIGSLPSVAEKGAPTLDMIASMDDNEFDAYWEQIKKAG